MLSSSTKPDRSETAGFSAICLTVDSVRFGSREADWRNNFNGLPPGMTLANYSTQVVKKLQMLDFAGRQCNTASETGHGIVDQPLSLAGPLSNHRQGCSRPTERHPPPPGYLGEAVGSLKTTTHPPNRSVGNTWNGGADQLVGGDGLYILGCLFSNRTRGRGPKR